MRVRWPSRYGSFVAVQRFPSSGWELSVMINGRCWAWWKGGSSRFDNIWRKEGEKLPR